MSAPNPFTWPDPEDRLWPYWRIHHTALEINHAAIAYARLGLPVFPIWPPHRFGRKGTGSDASVCTCGGRWRGSAVPRQADPAFGPPVTISRRSAPGTRHRSSAIGVACTPADTEPALVAAEGADGLAFGARWPRVIRLESDDAERRFSWRGTGRDRRRRLSFGMRRACANRHDSQPHRTPTRRSRSRMSRRSVAAVVRYACCLPTYLMEMVPNRHGLVEAAVRTTSETRPGPALPAPAQLFERRMFHVQSPG